MPPSSRKPILSGLAVFFAYLVYQVFRTRHYIAIGDHYAANAVPFRRRLKKPGMHILFVGDSTAVGTGASHAQASIAGLIGKCYPRATVHNFAVNGARVTDVIKQLQRSRRHYDVIFIHAGGNDTVRFTDLDTLRTDVRHMLDLAKQKGKYLLLTATGNVGTAALFPLALRRLWEWRTRQTRQIFLEALRGEDAVYVRYVDLFRERCDDPFACEPQTYYSEDLFHPSDVGYRAWLPLMIEELKQFPFPLAANIEEYPTFLPKSVK